MGLIILNREEAISKILSTLDMSLETLHMTLEEVVHAGGTKAVGALMIVAGGSVTDINVDEVFSTKTGWNRLRWVITMPIKIEEMTTAIQEANCAQTALQCTSHWTAFESLFKDQMGGLHTGTDQTYGPREKMQISQMSC